MRGVNIWPPLAAGATGRRYHPPPRPTRTTHSATSPPSTAAHRPPTMTRSWPRRYVEAMPRIVRRQCLRGIRRPRPPTTMTRQGRVACCILIWWASGRRCIRPIRGRLRAAAGDCRPAPGIYLAFLSGSGTDTGVGMYLYIF